ncbi:MAG: LON peptidase substrate-binding domain-containing protein [Pseudomonadota bacterium]|nr:LON peptidase substrate-binding domain-containing protein [Pseudomonadota bacterium]
MSTPVPVFPLNVPLLPGCQMPLQIFEQRYLEMVANCMREQSGFVVALLKPGSERQEVIRREQNSDSPAPASTAPADTAPGSPAPPLPFYPVGTLARIVDFGQRDNGLLAITIAGEQRQALNHIRQAPGGLWLAECSPLSEFGDPHPVDLSQMNELLTQVLEVNNMRPLSEPESSPATVMNHLIMLMPFSAPLKQRLLECDGLDQRWQGLRQGLAELVAKAQHQSD